MGAIRGIDYDNDNRSADYDHEEWYTDWHLWVFTPHALGEGHKYAFSQIKGPQIGAVIRRERR